METKQFSLLGARPMSGDVSTLDLNRPELQGFGMKLCCLRESVFEKKKHFNKKNNIREAQRDLRQT